MTITTTCLSYTQEKAERLMANSLVTSEGRLKFESTYGCGDFLGIFPTHIVDVEKIKENLFAEYDGLWKELAKR